MRVEDTGEGVLTAVVPAAVAASYQVQVGGVWRDALLVHEVAARLFGSSEENACERVRDLIRSGQLFALSTGRRHLVPVSAYVAYLRGERYPAGLKADPSAA